MQETLALCGKTVESVWVLVLIPLGPINSMDTYQNTAALRPLIQVYDPDLQTFLSSATKLKVVGHTIHVSLIIVNAVAPMKL